MEGSPEIRTFSVSVWFWWIQQTVDVVNLEDLDIHEFLQAPLSQGIYPSGARSSRVPKKSWIWKFLLPKLYCPLLKKGALTLVPNTHNSNRREVRFPSSQHADVSSINLTSLWKARQCVSNAVIRNATTPKLSYTNTADVRCSLNRKRNCTYEKERSHLQKEANLLST